MDGTFTPAIRFRGISKRYPGIVALHDVSFDVAPGSCHAICGENGAGKSTLGRILAGVHRADEGTIEIDGRLVSFASPRDALAAGVAMVHQELVFCENMSVAENLCLGNLPRSMGFVNRTELARRATALLRDVGADIDPALPMSVLSIAEQQQVQIAAAVGAGARVMVFDEPTSSLGETEANALYALMAQLKSHGVTLLLVSHRMPEIFRLCDTITVLRDGQHVATQPAGSVTEASLVQQMIGRELALHTPVHTERLRGAEMLRVTSLTSQGRFENVSFALHAGEVLGLAGLVGAGRSEIAHAIFGLDDAVQGDVHVRGVRVAIRTPRDAMRAGIGFVPEDRKRQGLVLGMRNRENATLPVLDRFARGACIDRRAELGAVSTVFGRIALRGSSEAETSSLSGGNQQKVVLSKWMLADSSILILDEPTRGVDVGAKAELHAWIDEKASQGAAILLISSELPELLRVSTRILIVRDGRVSGEVSRVDATQELLLRMMTGID